MTIKQRLKKLEAKNAEEAEPYFFTTCFQEKDGSVDPSKSIFWAIVQGKDVSPEPGETEEEFRSRLTGRC